MEPKQPDPQEETRWLPPHSRAGGENGSTAAGQDVWMGAPRGPGGQRRQGKGNEGILGTDVRHLQLEGISVRYTGVKTLNTCRFFLLISREIEKKKGHTSRARPFPSSRGGPAPPGEGWGKPPRGPPAHPAPRPRSQAGAPGHRDARPRPARQRPVTRSFWMDRMRLRAASQLARLPVMTMVSELLFSAGRSILVLLSSRICEDRGR